MGYVVLPVTKDPEGAYATMAEVLRLSFPGWTGEPGDFGELALRSTAELYAEVAALATRLGDEALRYFGRGVAALPPIDATVATGRLLVTAQDTAGPYIVPEGLEVTGRSPLGEALAFRTITERVIAAGVATVEVDVEAVEEGAAWNGVSGAADFAEYVDYLTAVAFVGSTSGGLDREDDEAFLLRLTAELAIASPRPILPVHFEVLARRLGAFRATAIDGLDPTDGTTENRAMMTVALVGPDGEPLASGQRTAIGAALTAMREVGWVVHAIDPMYTTIDVAFAGTSYPGWDPDAVETACVEALQAYLSPTLRGIREDTGESREWLNETAVRYLEVAERLQRVEGLRYVDSLTINAAGGAPGTANVALVGYAPLTRPGAITGTVTAS